MSSDEEFNCYRMLHAIYRSNSLELVGILKELSSTWDIDEVKIYVLNSKNASILLLVELSTL